MLEVDSGTLVKTCDVKGREPIGVTVNDNGNIYVCYRSREICVWLGNMDAERHLSVQGGLVSWPRVMVYSSRRQEIIFTRRDSDLIHY